MSDNVTKTQVDPDKIKAAIKGIVDNIVDLALEFVLPADEDQKEITNGKADKTPTKDN